MATKNGSGCGALIALGVVGFLVSRCFGNRSEPDAQPLYGSTDRYGSEASTPAHQRYVQADTLNCRAEPSMGGAIVRRYEANDRIEVTDEDDSWRLVPEAGCWVSGSYLGFSRRPPPRYVAPQRFVSEDTGSRYYANCSAARAAGAAPVLRGEPGYARRLDRDGDGIGCE